MEVSLVMVNAEGESRPFPIKRLPASIGRGEDCKVRVPLAAVSRHHCDLAIEDEELVVRDAGSSNGTYVNGERVRSRELIPGDVLSVGPVVFVVRIDGHPKEIDALESYAAGAVATEGASAHAGVPSWGAQNAPTKSDGGLEPLVGKDAEDSDFDFDLDLGDLDEDE